MMPLLGEDIDDDGAGDEGGNPKKRPSPPPSTSSTSSLTTTTTATTTTSSTCRVHVCVHAETEKSMRTHKEKEQVQAYDRIILAAVIAMAERISLTSYGLGKEEKTLQANTICSQAVDLFLEKLGELAQAASLAERFGAKKPRPQPARSEEAFGGLLKQRGKQSTRGKIRWFLLKLRHTKVSNKEDLSAKSTCASIAKWLTDVLGMLEALQPFIRQYDVAQLIGCAPCKGDDTHNVLQLCREDLESLGVDVNDLESETAQLFVDVVACLFARDLVAFPFKSLYAGMAPPRMQNLRHFVPTIAHSESLSHGVHVDAKWPDGSQLLPLSYEQQSTTFVHAACDDDDMDVLVDLFQERQRLKGTTRGEPYSPWSAFHQHAFTRSLLLCCLAESHSLTLHNLRTALFERVRECTQFKPSLVVSVIDFLKCRGGCMLDFCAGWGGRLAGAIAADMHTYHAFDPNIDLKRGHDALRRAFLPDERQDDFAITYTGFESAVLEPDYYDLVLTSPPPFHFEVYTQLSGQSIDTYPSFEDWIVRFLLHSICRAFDALKVGGKCVIGITDDHETRVCEAMCLLVLAAIPHASYSGVLCSLDTTKHPQPLWVFAKTACVDHTTQETARENLATLFPSIYEVFEVRSTPDAGHAGLHGDSEDDIECRSSDESTASTTARSDAEDAEFEHDVDANTAIPQKRAHVKDGEAEKLFAKLSPPVPITDVVCYPANGQAPFTVHVLRDDILPGGTKQRALADLVLNSDAEEFVYAGPVSGFAQVALGYVAYLLGVMGTAIVAEQVDGSLHPQTQLAKAYGATVIEVPQPNQLRNVQAYATEYARKRRDMGVNVFLIPFGLHFPEFMAALERRLRVALPAPLLANPPKRLWLAAGSATVLNVLARIFPTTHFLAVQVGKRVWPDQIGVNEDGSKRFECTLFVSPEKFKDIASSQPPYPSVRTYDAKLWMFVEWHGEDGDYIWNVASDHIAFGNSMSTQFAKYDITGSSGAVFPCVSTNDYQPPQCEKSTPNKTKKKGKKQRKKQ